MSKGSGRSSSKGWRLGFNYTIQRIAYHLVRHQLLDQKRVFLSTYFSFRLLFLEGVCPFFFTVVRTCGPPVMPADWAAYSHRLSGHLK